jgi:hypothetical protein
MNIYHIAAGATDAQSRQLSNFANDFGEQASGPIMNFGGVARRRPYVFAKSRAFAKSRHIEKCPAIVRVQDPTLIRYS